MAGHAAEAQGRLTHAVAHGMQGTQGHAAPRPAKWPRRPRNLFEIS